MKKLFLLAFAAGLFAACNNNATDTTDSTNVSTDAPVVEETAPLPDSTQLADSTTLNADPNAAPVAPADSAAHKH
ncbi:hypothetical protein [Chitinophaga deserti]|uniref:hypothetical protein n=1 Tax=Chitinophaga deserti TaxID=2164099 RepID=UPI000D6D1C91|nr:hypothetical protein [Chitinophaga deserti]